MKFCYINLCVQGPTQIDFLWNSSMGVDTGNVGLSCYGQSSQLVVPWDQVWQPQTIPKGTWVALQLVPLYHS